MYLKIFMKTSLFCALGLTISQGALARHSDGDSPVGINQGQVLEILADHFDHASLSADYRFQRDAAAVAVGCSAIPSAFWGAKGRCLKRGLEDIRTGEEKFGNIIKNICTLVQNTIKVDVPAIGLDLKLSYAIPIVTFSDCVGNIAKAFEPNFDEAIQNRNYPYKSMITAIYKSCEDKSWPYWWDKPKCYSDKLPHIEDVLEALPKTNSVEVTITPKSGEPYTVNTNSTLQLPPRSEIDNMKMAVLRASCTSMNSSALPASEKSNIKKSEITYSIFREEHCLVDGLFAIATGSTVPGTIMAACKNRIPGQEIKIVNNVPRDFKTMCLKAGVNAAGDFYKSINTDLEMYTFPGLVNLIGGFWDASIIEDELGAYDRRVRGEKRGQEDKRSTDKIQKILDGLTTEDYAKLTAAVSEKLRNEANSIAEGTPVPRPQHAD